jgi:hypothetical protein
VKEGIILFLIAMAFVYASNQDFEDEQAVEQHLAEATQ